MVRSISQKTSGLLPEATYKFRFRPGLSAGIVRASRPNTDESPDFVNKWVAWGAGPRGVLTLVTCAKARAILYGRHHATVGDVQAIAKPALRHRIAANFAAQAAGVNSEQLIDLLMQAVPADRKYTQPAAASA